MTGEALMKTAIVYEAIGADPSRDRLVKGELTVVAIGDPAELAAVVTRLAREGTELIELCGGISPRWRPVAEAAAGAGVKVSSATFGIESLAAAARFNQAHRDGTPLPEAFIVIMPRADPDRDGFVVSFPPQHTRFIPVPDEAAAVTVAHGLVADGYGLIELYGGFTSQGAGAVIDAVAGRLAVGVGSFTVEATVPMAGR